jgi:glucokinase
LAVAIENDAAMALLAEHALGAARGCESAVLLTVGTGIGGAALEGGRLLRGRGTAGQLGHLVVHEGGQPCPCGRHGCLETESSGSAFARHLAEAGLPEGTRAEDLLARPGDPAAGRVLAAWAAPMRRAILTLAAALGPEAILLGGGAGGAMAQALARLPPDPSGWFEAPVRPAALGDAAGVVGAGLAALDAAGLGRTRRALLVNGVPASGKSRVARAMADALGWPLLALDTVKGPFLAELPPGDRPFNRSLGRAAYAAIWDTLAESPGGTGVVIDAWFGFQPLSLLDEGLARAGVGRAAEIWCEAPPEEVGRRYAARVPERGPGHPGLAYVPELIELARRAAPTGRAPVLRLDTTQAFDRARTLAWVRRALAKRPQESA